MKLAFAYAVASLMILPTNSFANSPLTWAEYRDAKVVIRRLMETNRAHETAFVLLGRSPTVIGAFLEELGLETYFLPMSDLASSNSRSNLIRKLTLVGRLTPLRLEAWQIAYLDQHFGYFLPGHLIRSDKQLVLIDYVGTGTSLRRARNLLANYLKRGPRGTRSDLGLRTFSLAAINPITARAWRAAFSDDQHQHHTFRASLTGLGPALAFKYHKDYAPYGRFTDYQWGRRAARGEPYLPPQKIEEPYQRLRASLRQQIKRDPDFAALQSFTCSDALRLSR